MKQDQYKFEREWIVNSLAQLYIWTERAKKYINAEETAYTPMSIAAGYAHEVDVQRVRYREAIKCIGWKQLVKEAKEKAKKDV